MAYTNNKLRDVKIAFSFLNFLKKIDVNLIFIFMNDNLKTSFSGLQFIERWEGCVLKPYKDVAGLRTIGIGYLIKPTDNFPDGVAITKEKAYELLAEEVKKCEDSIKNNIKVSLNQNQFDALVSFGFNCGTGVYSNSGVARALNSGDYSKVPERLLDWCKARIDGKLQIVKGLYDRRKAEGDLFMGSFSVSTSNSNTSTTKENSLIAWSKDLLIEVQKALKAKNIYIGNVDGSWGPMTRGAVLDFAKRNGISLKTPESGITQEFLDKIRLNK